jgi:glycosyltransferase involved in cell wall biosynthesis
VEVALEEKVSVILPVYNRSASIVAAINSVLSQSYMNIELIVVDDCSRENIKVLVDQVGDSRISYIRRDRNGGAGAARNTGLLHATGEFIAFQDSDDLWLPGKLRRQMDLLAAAPSHVGVVTGGKIVYGRDNQFKYGPTLVAYSPPPAGLLRLDEDQLAHLLRDNRISVQNTLFRRAAVPFAPWFDTCARANEDWEFAIRLSQHTTIFEDPEPVVLGFVSHDSISRSGRRETIGVLRILRKNRSLLNTKKEERSRLMISVARYLWSVRKPKSALRFLIAGLRADPRNLGDVVLPFARRISRSLVLNRWAPAKM